MTSVVNERKKPCMDHNYKTGTSYTEKGINCDRFSKVAKLSLELATQMAMINGPNRRSLMKRENTLARTKRRLLFPPGADLEVSRIN